MKDCRQYVSTVKSCFKSINNLLYGIPQKYKKKRVIKEGETAENIKKLEYDINGLFKFNRNYGL
jgi:hypothetical protein